MSDNESVATSVEDQTQQQIENLEDELQCDDDAEGIEHSRSTKRPLPKKKFYAAVLSDFFFVTKSWGHVPPSPRFLCL